MLSYQKKDVCEFMKNNKELFDLSNYDKNYELYDETNKKVLKVGW